MSEFVPVIDISDWAGGASSRRAEIAAAVDGGCREIGFLQILGHGVDRGVIDAMVREADAFFALPEAEKLRYGSASAEVNRGYAALGSESLTYSLGLDTPPDMFEAFNIGPEDVDESDPAIRAERHRIFAPNIWPEHQPGMRTAWMAYFDEVAKLVRRLTAIFAVALGQPEDFFEPMTDHSTDTLRVIHYERRAGSADPLPGQARMGGHTDYGIVTALHADQVPGLQILDPSGGWHDVVPLDGAYLVNLGDLLAQWTNDRWRSTLHRVVPPPAGDSGPAVRRSAAFFHDGNHDALVEVMSTCCSADDPPRYPPVLAGDHLMAKLTAPRTRVASRATDFAGDRIDALRPPAPAAASVPATTPAETPEM